MNCLSNIVFENLLFVDVIAGCETGVALFDSGAQKTVVSEKFLRRCKGDMLAETVKAGNNNGQTMSLNMAMLKSIKIADKELTNLEVLVIEDDMFVMQDKQGRPFLADMLLGYDVISKFKWVYSPFTRVLDISDSNMITRENLVHYNVFPTINIISGGQSYVAGIDTGHTETILGTTIKTAICNPVYIEDDVVGVGSKKKMYVPMIPEFNLEFEGTEVKLHNITMQEKIYGAPKEMDILLGMDFFEGRAWEMDFAAGILRFFDAESKIGDKNAANRQIPR